MDSFYRSERDDILITPVITNNANTVGGFEVANDLPPAAAVSVLILASTSFV